MQTDIEIAQAAKLLPISTVASKLGLRPEDLIPYGHSIAKINPATLQSLAHHKNGKLILVTAISPTPAGEGKTTTTIGLADALNLALKNKSGQQQAVVCIREPSLGPVFGLKGGATGGGHAQVVPMEDINLHFTGDFHAISAANNLLAALVDNHLHHGNALRIDPSTISWRRCMDMNDRALRHITLHSALKDSQLFERTTGFDITVASEVMAIFCLASSLQDLEHRLGQIQVGLNLDQEPVLASDLQAAGAMTALLKNAFQPNLVQTLSHTPAIVHGGPFANIAHGCNSVVATQAALKLADYVVTEAGFGADLGAEKFMDIKCRKSDLRPDLAVLVATVRALKYHGGVEVKSLNNENLQAVQAGMVNLQRHVQNLQQHFGLKVIVAINHFATDTDAEIDLVKVETGKLGIEAVVCRHWAQGGEGAIDLAEQVLSLLEQPSHSVKLLYPNTLTLIEKLETVARKIYGADAIHFSDAAQAMLDKFEKDYGHFPVCIAKTQYSFSTDPTLRGAPSGHTLQIRELRLSRGAGFIVAICGDLMTMPGLPAKPASEHIGVSHTGEITGLN
jgi:formate--tetrahydrofolate ligase